MPTPEATKCAYETITRQLEPFLHDALTGSARNELRDIIAEALDRFAAQRGAEHRVRYARYGGPTNAAECSRIMQTPFYRHGDAILVWVNEGDIVMLGNEEGAPSQTGGGDAPTDDENGRRDAERLCTRPDTAAPTISPPGAAAGGGDAPVSGSTDGIITIELHGEDAERASEIFDAMEGLLLKMGDIGLLSMKTEPSQTGGGALGLRDRPELTALIENARAAYAAMSPEDREAHDKAQRESWVRGNIELDRLERQTTSMAQTSGGDAKFGEPVARNFTGETPGPGWKISDETQRELEQMEQRMKMPPQTSGGDAGEWARAAVEALPSCLFDRKHTEEIVLHLMPEFEAALRSSHREGAEEARQDALRVPFTKALVAEARIQGYRDGAEAMREADEQALAAEDEFWLHKPEARMALRNARKRMRALPIPGKTE